MSAAMQPGSRADRHSLLTAFGIALACSLAFVTLFPGMSNADIANEYLGIQRGAYSDWHPPIMAAVWRLVDGTIAGKAGLFVIFAAAYALCAFGLTLCALRVSRMAAAFVAATLLFPGFLTQGAMLYKDFLMAALLGCGAASGLLYACCGARPLRLVWLFVALAATLAGSLLRANAVFAATPLFLVLLDHRFVVRRQNLAMLSIGVSLLLIPFDAAINELAFHPRKTSVENSLFIFDFAGITHFSGENVFPEVVRKSYTLADNDVCYLPTWWDPFIDWRDLRAERFGPTDLSRFAFVADKRLAPCQQVWRIMRHSNLEGGHSFATDWLGAILRHPIAYLAHRISHFNIATEFLVPSDRTISRATEQRNEFGWVFATNAVSASIIALANLFGSSPPCWPFFLLIVSIVSFASAPSIEDRPTRRLVEALSCSGTLYTLGFLAVGIASEYRYHAWLFLSAGTAMSLSLGCAYRQRTLRPLLIRYAAWSAPFVLLGCVWRVGRHAAPDLLWLRLG